MCGHTPFAAKYAMTASGGTAGAVRKKGAVFASEGFFQTRRDPVTITVDVTPAQMIAKSISALFIETANASPRSSPATSACRQRSPPAVRTKTAISQKSVQRSSVRNSVVQKKNGPVQARPIADHVPTRGEKTRRPIRKTKNRQRKQSGSISRRIK